MKNILFYLPAIIFSIFFTWSITYLGLSFSPVIFVWLALFLVGGILLNKGKFWGGFLGMLPGIHWIYMGTQDTGQIFSETPLGIIVTVFYFVCGSFIFYKSKKSKSHELKSPLDLDIYINKNQNR